MIPAACVIDASVAVKWLVAEPDSALAMRLLDSELAAPDLLGTECANVLWKHVRRGHLAAAEALDRLAALADMPIALVPAQGHLAGALRRALDRQHPAYDCLYLEVAAALGRPLVTADRRLLALADARARVVALDSLA